MNGKRLIQCPHCKSVNTSYVIDVCTPGLGDNWYRADLYQCKDCKMVCTIIG